MTLDGTEEQSKSAIKPSRRHSAWTSLVQRGKCKLEVQELSHDLGHFTPPGLDEWIQEVSRRR